MNEELTIPVGRAIMAMPIRLITLLRILPNGGDRVDVAVTDGGECHDGPSESIADVFKGFGLRIALDVIRDDGREAYHDAAGGVGCHQLVAHGIEHLSDCAECFGVAYHLE